MKEVDIYLGTLKGWKRYLSDPANPFVDEPRSLPYMVAKAMRESDSDLFLSIVAEMQNRPGVWLKTHIKRRFQIFFALEIRGEEGGPEMAPLLDIGWAFLQNISDLALDMGVDAGTIESCTHMRPRGVGVVTSAEDTIQGCQAGNNIARSGNDGAVCNSGISPMENPSKKGRPVIPFKDLMIDDDDGSKLRKVHILMNGKMGKRAALVILSCVLKGWMTMPKFKQVQVEFGCVGVRQGFTKYLNKESFTDVEIEGAMKNLKLSE